MTGDDGIIPHRWARLMRSASRLVVAGLLFWGFPPLGWGGSCQPAATTDHGVFKVHLTGECTEGQREAHAVNASAILTAVKEGKAIDLSGVVIRGDLGFDDLPVGFLPKDLESRLPVMGGEVRFVPSSISIVHSTVRGAVRHRSPRGFLVVGGPVTLIGTKFEQTMDLSRAVFAEPVVLSGAVFLQESYFVQGQFLRDVFAEKTAFGPHTRFHRARFHGPVTFQQSGFNGMAEFLEVEFERGADFSRTYFKLGTGFSGSRFSGLADFSETLFDREAYFTFTRFDGDASFRRATFRSTADFDDAEFKARDDFSKVLFEGESKFARIKRPVDGPAALGIENPKVQLAITLSLLIFSVLLIAYLVKSQ